MSTEVKLFQRLSDNVKPFNYKIEIEPDLKSFIFNGKEDIYIEIFRATNSITFNSSEIDIKLVYYIDGSSKEIKPLVVDVNEENETVTLIFPENLSVGKSGYLHLEFQGHLNDKLKGFYRSKYTSLDGIEKYSAVTQFEPSDARRCFPCWDEPSIRATFDITLIIPNDLLALSNMPVKSSSVITSSNKISYTYQTTPSISTYLVAMVVGEYDYIEEEDSNGICLRIYTPKGKTEQGVYALHVATKVLPFYHSYFKIPYPLPKMDLIAISDFAAGAMENWGLITYRETSLLVDANNSSSIVKQNVALTIAHEISHQWFGNLVTMNWWTHLWLNEGFASFLEFLCVDYLIPEYDIWTQFVTQLYIPALELDALKNSHPVEVPINHPKEIEEIFDDISYNKGACILRMLHSYIGDDDFRKGVNLYLKRHMYADTKTEDLWQAFAEVSNKPVLQFMPSWTKQQGFPLLTVSEKSSDGNKRVLNFSQERFLADGSMDEEETLWAIPLAISSSENPEKILKNEIMETKTKDIVIENIAPNSWIKVNPGVIGVYRTLYSNNLLESLLPAIENQSLPPLDRLNILDDLFALCKAGQISTIKVLKVIQSFKGENNYTVWYSIINCLMKIDALVSHYDIYPKYQMFVCTLLQDIHSYLGWDKKENESHLDTLLRSLVLSSLVHYKDEATIAEAHRRFEAHIFGDEILPANLRSSVYKAVFISSGADMFDTLINLYRETDLHEERERILRALGPTTDLSLIRRILQFSISHEVRIQDTRLVVFAVTQSHLGRILALDFLKNNYKSIAERCQSGTLFSSLVKGITENVIFEIFIEDLELLFKTNPNIQIQKTVQQCIETIKLNAAWFKRDEDAIVDFLKQY